MEIVKIKKIGKNYVEAILTMRIHVVMDGKVVKALVNDVIYFKKDNKRWISFPQKVFEKDGEKKYVPNIKFEDGSDREVQEKILKMIDNYKPPEELNYTPEVQFEIPF